MDNACVIFHCKPVAIQEYEAFLGSGYNGLFPFRSFRKISFQYPVPFYASLQQWRRFNFLINHKLIGKLRFDNTTLLEISCALAKLNQWTSFPRLVTEMRRKSFVYLTSGWIIPLA